MVHDFHEKSDVVFQFLPCDKHTSIDLIRGKVNADYQINR